MPWPLSQDYNEAIQTPAISFDDADLRAGEPAANAMGLPMPRSGSFADVYEFRSPKGHWAIKCFTREVANLGTRYRLISQHLQKVKLPFFVDFQYLDRGIRVRGQWFPILKMQWVEGQLLNEFIRNNLDRPASWVGLIPMWLRMAQRLNEAGIAHGDLQHGNIILVPGQKAGSLALKLIDYDGLFVPDLEGIPSGEVGHANYQHPIRFRDGVYNKDVDRLPLLSIYAALRCLTVGGRSLWDQYDNGDNLLFRQPDLANPIQSPAFRALWQLPDRDCHSIVGNLAISLLGPMRDVPLLAQIQQGDAIVPLRTDQTQWLQSHFGPTLFSSPSPKLGKKVPPVKLADLVSPETSASFPLLAPGSASVVDTSTSPRQSARSWQLAAYGLTGVATLAVFVGMFFGVDWSETLAENSITSPQHPLAASRDKRMPQTVSDAKQSNSEIEKSIGMKLVYIPAGRFKMGSLAGEQGLGKNGTQHEVEITKGFWLGKYEVTQEEYEKVMGQNPSRNKGAKLPVENVSWDEATEFCRKLSEKEGKTYRLPTEAEWEYACRAGTTTQYAFGDTILKSQANFQGDATKTVGSYAPNAWGLYDMHGNVAEWCSDWFGAYPRNKVIDPVGPLTGYSRVFKGGSFGFQASIVRSSNRGHAQPSNRVANVGFRVASNSGEVLPSSGSSSQQSTANTKNSESEIENSIGIKLVYIPAGSFKMGSPASEQDRKGNEIQHEVEFTKGFWLGKYEVTQEEYEKVIGKNPSHNKGPRLPVENISWNDAMEFCRKLSEKEGKNYRLPTEAEWEYACRAGTTTQYAFGDAILKGQGNFGGTPTSPTKMVGSYAPNSWGLYDMHGNVWEWCSDWYGDYPQGKVVDPIGPASGKGRVLRGGSFYDLPSLIRSANRTLDQPTTRFITLGFRLASDSVANLQPIAPVQSIWETKNSVSTIVNSIGMKLAHIPPGKFTMGSPVNEQGRSPGNSELQHEVRLTRDFYMGIYEVTQEEYKKVMRVNPSHFSQSGSGKSKVAGIDTSRFPVEGVSWHDAAEFCKRLSNMPGEKAMDRVYELPTEARVYASKSA